jgi:hypothetical protein
VLLVKATSFVFVAISLLASACGGAQHAVEVKGRDTDLVELAGDWEGSYTGLESGRSGPVSFKLELGRHVAEGDVLLGATPLAIQFVAVEGGTISGQIDPYTDPTCDCQVQTEFVGLRSGDSISGTFTTSVIGANIEQHGEWSVSRKN